MCSINNKLVKGESAPHCVLLGAFITADEILDSFGLTDSGDYVVLTKALNLTAKCYP